MNAKFRLVPFCLIAVISFMNPHLLIAETPSVIKYLMSEPATMFDLGMYRLNAALKEASPGFFVSDKEKEYSHLAKFKFYYSALYDQGILLNIQMIRFGDIKMSKTVLQKSMKDLIRLIKIYVVGINPDTRKEILTGAGDLHYGGMLSEAFLHVTGSFSTVEEQNKFVNDIRQITRIRVTSMFGEGLDSHPVECTCGSTEDIGKVYCH